MFFTPTPHPQIDVCLHQSNASAVLPHFNQKGSLEEFQKCEKLRFKGERSVSK